MSAVLKIKEMLKEINEAGDVNAMRIWRGYDNEGNYGWQYQRFGRSEIHFMGKSLAEVREYVDEELSFREDISEYRPTGADLMQGGYEVNGLRD